jgi:hypothetical protein
MDGTGEHILSKVSQVQKAKNCMFSLICRLLPKTNTVILLDMGYMLRWEYIQEESGMVGNPKLESVCCAHHRRANIVTLKWQRSLWESDQQVIKKSGRDESILVVIPCACKQC